MVIRSSVCYHPPMLASVKRLLPRLRLLLILAAALGCFIFLFNLFGGLQSPGDTGLLDRADPSATTIEVLNGAQLTAVLASFLCLALAVGSAWVCWQRLKGPNEKRLLTVLLSSLCAVGLFALGLYLGAVAVTQRGLPYGSLPYDHHRIDLTGVEPLGLALLAGFILSVAVVGIVRPRFVIVPVLVWLVLAFIFGMFESDAIRGLNLFDRLSRLQPVLAYQEIIDGYLPPVPGLAVAVPVETVPDPDAAEALLLDLGSQDAETAENAAIALEELGAEVIGLETGGFLVKWDARVYLVPGITAKQTEPPKSEPVFSVRGATETGHLRTEVGDAYTGGIWAQLNPLELSYLAGADVRTLVVAELSEGSATTSAPSPKPESALLSHNWITPEHANRRQEITVSPYLPGGSLPVGPLPVSLNLDLVRVDGNYSPFSGTFDSKPVPSDYTWISRVPEFSQEQLRQAVPTSDEAYLGLPGNLPTRVWDLARRIAEGHDGPYLKAKAIEDFLQREYTYGFAGLETPERPLDQDPVDWFLFDSRRGTSGQFSSAFVVMVRSLGIPARVASGWAIAEVGVMQTVTSDQAHQWAEVGFADLGWVIFEPTGPGGPPSRAGSSGVWEAELARLSRILHTDPLISARTEAAGELVRFSEKSPLPAARVTKTLAEALRSDDSIAVRSAAARALGAVSDASVLEPLRVAVIADAAPEVRISAIHALAETGHDGAIPLISEALVDSDPIVRNSGEGVLTDLGAVVTQLENGGKLVHVDDEISATVAGISVMQAPEPPHIPVFRTRGTNNTKYFRTGVGDVYQNGVWSQSHLLELPYPSERELLRLVDRLLPDYLGNRPADAPDPKSTSLAWPSGGFGSQSQQDRITVSSVHSSELLTAGVWPISLGARYIFSAGHYRPFSATFRSDQSLETFSWLTRTQRPSRERLVSAAVTDDPFFTQLPDDLPSRVRDLAGEITRGHDTPYLKAKAIESYLRGNYTYAFAGPDSTGPPVGRDPVDWFLFDQRRGTCGQFSSAFVILARAAGIPARAVSGWVVSPQDDWQTIHADQAHQWAEVAFEKFGWVTFEPTAPAGAPARTPGFQDGVSGAPEPVLGSEARTALEAIAADNPDLASAIEERLGAPGQEGSSAADRLEELLANNPSENSLSAAEILAAVGAEVTPLENGGALVSVGTGASWIPGTTTGQASEHAAKPMFQVTGGVSTGYLRTTTGDVYSDGRWSQIDPVQLPYQQGEGLPVLVDRSRSHWDLSAFPAAPSAAMGLLAWPKPGYGAFLGLDRIRVSAHPEAGNIPAGRKPISLRADQILIGGTYAPLSATFASEDVLTEYSWMAQHVVFPTDQLVDAEPFVDAAYTQLPGDLPPRIRELALKITAEHDSAYLKAKAIERFLRDNFIYAFASADAKAPPPGHDPVDWFLFEAKQGTCGQFSSAFVVLARSVGLPARVVSGWSVGSSQQSRMVYSDQAHQWAEVSFESLGWITFEPTAAGGPPSRNSETGDEGRASVPEAADRTSSQDTDSLEENRQPRETIIEISQWPVRTRLGAPFTIAGTVTTTPGTPVDHAEVEIFINEKKENGGVKVGMGTAERGRFSVEIRLPARFARGSYQLIAHALANSEYGESWSDPEIKVYSGTGLQLTGPAEVSVDTAAQFSGQLSEGLSSGVANQEIQITVGGQPAAPAYTDAAGEFQFSHRFIETGEHLVEARFVEADFLLGNEAQLVLKATMPSVLEIQVSPQVQLDTEFPVTGYLRDGRGHPLAGQEVTVSFAGGPPHSVVTDSQGTFHLNDAIDSTGVHTLVATFDGDGNIEPSSYRASIKVAESVSITLVGDRVARVGHPYRLTGKLAGMNGRPLPDSRLSVGVTGGTSTVVYTDPEGSFRWQTVFDAEAEATVEVGFAGTASLESSRRFWPVEVATAQIAVEVPETISRGDDLTLWGAVVVGNQTASDVKIVVTGHDDGQIVDRTNAAGSFTVVFPVEADADTGRLLLKIAAPELDTVVETATEVVSAASVIVVPLEQARPGRPLQLEARLLDDRGQGISGAVLHYGEDGQVITEADGVAILTVPIPDTDDPSVVPLTLTFDGDESHLPVTYTVGLSVTPPTFDWLLWVGLPLLLTLCTTLAYVWGRKRLSLVPGRGRGRDSAGDLDGPSAIDILSTAPAGGDALGEATSAESDGVPARPADEVKREPQVVTSLVIRFPDLPPGVDRIWRLGETVRVECTLTLADEEPLAAANLYLEWTDSAEPVLLTTDREGRCIATWSGVDRGTHRVTARYPGDERHSPSSTSEEFELRGPVPTLMEVNISKPADDLPDVWGTGEKIQVEFSLVDAYGLGVVGRHLIVAIGDSDQPVEVITDASGRGHTDLTGPIPGTYQIAADFAGDPDYLPTSRARQIELVEFRQDVVLRYNNFLAWVRGEVPNIPDQATPREMEALVVASGLPLDQRALEEVIARFEEADYSLHEIGRARFESMYRACLKLMADQAHDGH